MINLLILYHMHKESGIFVIMHMRAITVSVGITKLSTRIYLGIHYCQID